MSIDDQLLLILLEEEEDDDDLLFFANTKRKATDSFYKSRKREGCYNTLIKNHLINDEAKFREYCRLNKKQFNFIYGLIVDKIEAKVSGKEVINGEEKLFLTLRFMATGESFRSLSYSYRISQSYISRIVKHVLKVLREQLVPLLMKPLRENDFKNVEKGFWLKWNIPNCVGGIDGKHVRIKAPKNSGSLFFNYKDYFSVVLLAIVDANSKFIAIDVGSYGKESDNGIFQKSRMGYDILHGRFHIPQPKNLPGTNVTLPHFFIGDEAFGLSSFMMKPYPRKTARLSRDKEIFNYRLCRARRVTENAFGLLSQVFRVYYTPIAISTEVVDDLILTSCCLHNLLRDGYLEENNIPHYQTNNDNFCGQNMIGFVASGGFSNSNGFEIRENLKDFFVTENGAVSWQEAAISRI